MRLSMTILRQVNYQMTVKLYLTGKRFHPERLVYEEISDSVYDKNSRCDRSIIELLHHAFATKNVIRGI